MKTALKGILSLALYVLLQTSVSAQTIPPVAGATMLGTFTGLVQIGENNPNLGNSTSESEFEFIAWNVGGTHVISINVNSMSFPDDCDWARTFPLDDLMNEAGIDGLRKAIELGYVSCPTSCPSGNGIKVYYPTCVNRNINGSCPVITAEPTSDFSYNTYDICCDGGTPTITLVSSTCGSSSCGTGYQSTCGS